MLFLIRVFDATARTVLKRESERRLQLAAGRFERDIREIGVSLRDVNGPRGGVDKSCKVTARLRRGGTIEIEQTRGTFADAIQAAAKRLRYSLARLVGRKGNRKAWRADHVPFRRPWGLR